MSEQGRWKWSELSVTCGIRLQCNGIFDRLRYKGTQIHNIVKITIFYLFIFLFDQYAFKYVKQFLAFK